MLPFLELALPHTLFAVLAVLQTVLEYLFLRSLSFFLGISSSFHISERTFHHFEFPCYKTKEIIRNYCAGGCFSGYVCIWSNTAVGNNNMVGFCLALCYLLHLWICRFLLQVTWNTNSYWKGKSSAWKAPEKVDNTLKDFPCFNLVLIILTETVSGDFVFAFQTCSIPEQLLFSDSTAESGSAFSSGWSHWEAT